MKVWTATTDGDNCPLTTTVQTGTDTIGIDLGLKTLAVMSDGSQVPSLKLYRQYQHSLAKAQRAGNKRRVAAIHARIANARKDQHHKATAKIARENKLIVVGDVNSSQLAQTRMAKSVLDAGWSGFRDMLAYKARLHRAEFKIVNEAWTSRTCSSCSARSGPEGIAGLGIRRWECSGCGASHDRDVNAARNILNVGRSAAPLVEESRKGRVMRAQSNGHEGARGLT